jgi:HK97 family phage portal protein
MNLMQRFQAWIGRDKAPVAQAENSHQDGLSIEQLAAILGSPHTSYAGKAVTEHTARQVATVYACVALLAGAVATLPLAVYERTPDGRKRADHPYWWLLNEQPYSEVSAAVFWEFMVEAYLYHGDMFAEIVRPGFYSNQVSGLIPLHPCRVSAFRQDGRLLYRVVAESGAVRVLDSADVLHVPGLGFDGLRSVSPITYAGRQAIGTAMAAEEYSGKFFSNGARPDVVLETDSRLDKEQVEILRTTWANRHSGSGNAHLPAVLTGGLKIDQLSLSAEDAQLLATRGFQIEEVCRIFGVPPHMVGHTDKTTSWGSGVENMGRGFAKFTLSRHLVKIEQEINRKFWPSRERYFVEFNVAGLERGDLKSENEALRVSLGRAGEPGWMTVNEVRRIKNLPPVEGGDVLNSGVTNEKAAAAPGR